jgi:hypothetical protein
MRFFQGKTPFLDFSIKINHAGVQLCIREHPAAPLDVRQLGHRGFARLHSRAPAVFFENISQVCMVMRGL